MVYGLVWGKRANILKEKKLVIIIIEIEITISCHSVESQPNI